MGGCRGFVDGVDPERGRATGGRGNRGRELTPGITNRDLSDLLALASESNPPGSNKSRALRRAARASLTWADEAGNLVGAGRPLTELARVGPWVERNIRDLLERNEPPPEPSPLRRSFLTLTEVDRVLATAPRMPAIRCDLQMHTTWSDGHSTLTEMVEAAVARGYEHIAITDHSKGLAIAGGMDEARLRDQAGAIATANQALERAGAGMRILHGIEMNIAPDGTGDMDPTALAELDIVLGAFHSKLRLRDDQTERYLAALRNPDIHVLAHPRGRMFDFRIGLSADWPVVMAEAARLDKAVEIDGYADRQDLDTDLIAVARDAGARISIGSDAHHVVDLDFVRFGCAAAVLAGIEPDRVINLMSHQELLSWTASLRSRARS